MRKLLVATALVAALVAGPVLAQDAMTAAPAAPAATDSMKPAKAHHKKHAGKHHHKKAAAPAAEAPAAAQ